MKGLIAVAAVTVLLFTGIVYAKDYEVKKKAGEYDVAVMIDRNPPVVGDNNIAIVVKDSAGKDVTDARVTVEYSMPAMSGMPAMRYKAEAELKGNEYRAKMNLPTPGSWTVVVKIARAGKKATMNFVANVE